MVGQAAHRENFSNSLACLAYSLVDLRASYIPNSNGEV